MLVGLTTGIASIDAGCWWLVVAWQAVIAVAWLHRHGRSHDNICARNFMFSDNSPKQLLKVCVWRRTEQRAEVLS